MNRDIIAIGASAGGVEVLLERGDLRARFSEKAKTQREQAEYIRQLIIHTTVISEADADRLQQG